MKKIKVLFVCVQNTFRSQMAEAIMNTKYGELFEAESAGLEPGEVHPLAIEAMDQIGIDLRGKQTHSVFDFFKEHRFYSYVITVCSREAEKRCPIFPGTLRQLNWELPDVAQCQDSAQECLNQAVKLRQEIEQRIDALVQEIQAAH